MVQMHSQAKTPLPIAASRLAPLRSITSANKKPTAAAILMSRDVSSFRVIKE
jgi:hypothetical protein